MRVESVLRSANSTMACSTFHVREITQIRLRVNIMRYENFKTIVIKMGNFFHRSLRYDVSSSGSVLMFTRKST